MPELVYSIDKGQTEKEGLLVIKIEEATKIGLTFEFAMKTQTLYPSALRRLATSKDEDLLTWLMQQEIKYQKRTTLRTPNESLTSFNTIHIAPSQTFKTLELLAGTGKLFFHRRQIIPNLYGHVDFFYHADTGSDKTISIIGVLKTENQEFPLTECDLIAAGPPHWFIKGITLHVIATDISWNGLKQAYFQPATLTLSKIQEMIPDDESEAPKIVFAGNSAEVANHVSEPMPVLRLKDRTGAFADLWIDYGNGKCIARHDPRSQFEGKKRQIQVELSWEKDLLETNFIRKAVGTSHYYCPLDKVAKSLSFLLEVGWQIIDFKDNRVVHHGTTQLSLQQQHQSILVKGKMSYDTYEADIADVVGAFNRKERFLQLGNGVVGLLPENLEKAGLGGMTEEAEVVSGAIKVSRNRIGLLSELLDSTTLTLDPTLTSLRERLKTFQGPTPVTPGAAFQGELRHYQQEGLNWLAFLYEYGFHGILADDMGLGKTVQVLAFLSQLVLEGPILIVLPTSLLFNWKREIERFLPSWTVYLHQGPDRKNRLQELLSSGIILTSYTTLRLDLPILSQVQYQCLILDEAQAIKNANTQIAQAVYSLQARFRLSITGTPIENHLNEMWSHFHFLIPDLLGSENEFSSELQAATADSRFLQRIKKKIRPFVLRRKKEEVAKELPERIEQVVWVEMGTEQRKLYDDFLAGVRGNLFKKVDQDGLSKHRMEIFEAILRLRQICCHPLLVAAQLENSQANDSAKLQALLQDIETCVEEGSKALVFSQFTSMLSLLGKALKEKELPYAYLDGSTVNREKVVLQFQEDPAIPLFLISLKAGGIGLNLTAADYVFLYDPWWNEAVENQAINRAHRIGRHETVIAKRYVVMESIEEKMMKLKAAKRSLIEDVLDSDLAIPSMSEADFRFLLS